jgi:hypothetical protein
VAANATHVITWPKLTNGKITSDGLKPHDDLLAEFPYLGPPNRFTAG